MTAQLATASATSRLSNIPGRAIVTARGHHIIVDSPAPLGGPNEELNPLDVLLSALATCGTFVCETAAQEMGIPLQSISVTAAGDFDPRGVCGQPVDPRIQAFRIRLALSGPSEEQGEALAAAFKTRCPVYTTLSRAAPIDLEVITEPSYQTNGKEQKMRILKCRDVGFDCEAEIHAETDDEILRQAAEHVVGTHGLEVTPELVAQVQAQIHNSEPVA